MVGKNKEESNGCWLLVSDTMDCLKIFINVLMCDKVLREVSDFECLNDNFQKLIYTHLQLETIMNYFFRLSKA